VLVQERDAVFALIDCDDACEAKFDGQAWRTSDSPMTTSPWGAPELRGASLRAAVWEESWAPFSSMADRESPVSPAADVWGASLVTAWAATGDDAVDLASSLSTGQVEATAELAERLWATGLPASVARIVGRGLAMHPGQRPSLAQMAEVVSDAYLLRS
jgi:hypothetical protein